MGNFSMLPSEIIMEILSRLPVESILECKLVSKPWRNFVQHPTFSRLHLGHLDSTDDFAGKSSFITTRSIRRNLFYTEYDESLNLFSRTRKINLRHPFKLYYILGSCDGLICFNACDDIDLDCKPAYICNPITREYIMLPEAQGKGNFLTGFGYCSLSNKYKVVSICNHKEDPNFRIVQVYTLGSGIGWRNVGKMDNKMIPDRNSGVFANGAIHWLDSNQGTLLAFDLTDLMLHKIPSPPGLPPCSFAALNVSGNSVYAYFKYVRGWDIWILKKNRNCQDVIWSKEFSDSSHINVRPITFTKNGMLLGYDYVDKKAYRYAPQASPSRVLVESGILDDSFQFGVPHKNTLVSLRALGEEDTILMDSVKAAINSQRRRRKKEVS